MGAATGLDEHRTVPTAAGRSTDGLVRGQVVQILPSAPGTAGRVGGLAVVVSHCPVNVKLRRLHDDEVLHLLLHHVRDAEVRCGVPAGFTARMHAWPEATTL